MRISDLLFVLAAAESAAADCTPDACGDVITSVGTLPIPLATRSADCMSYLEVTITPNASYILWTTSADPETFGVIGRPTLTSSIPAYATECADAPAYSSACECAGLSVTTVAAAVPTVILYDTLPACVNPSVCDFADGNSVCGDGCGLCLQDADDPNSGWCLSDGYCTDTCSSGADCPPPGICLETCCGNSCATADNVAFCDNYDSAAKLFKRQKEGRPNMFGDASWVPSLGP
ncbi:hypothetical protein B7494_g729 [Chlorociboria aeruginascens]|nr:hypothetical protein B7494_g729 [Chlorociboria aeruginascens]